jgi:hypothetical protein
MSRALCNRVHLARAGSEPARVVGMGEEVRHTMTKVHASLQRAQARLREVAVRRLEARYLGANTGGDIWPHELGYSYGLYRATPWRVLRELFRGLEVAEDDVFVDIGSGMGASRVHAGSPALQACGRGRAVQSAQSGGSEDHRS